MPRFGSRQVVGVEPGGKQALAGDGKGHAAGVEVIQRRPYCSATRAVVPEPHVGSITRSPGSVVMRTQRAITFGLVCTT